MLIPLAAIATVFMGVWILAVAIKFKIRPLGKGTQKSETVLLKSGFSLISLLLFLFAPTRFTNSPDSLKFESEFHQSSD